MNWHERFNFFLKAAKEGLALNKTPKQVFETYKYEGLRRFLPKDKKLRKKGHIIGIINDLLSAIEEVYGSKPFIDFRIELDKLYGMFLPNYTPKNINSSTPPSKDNDSSDPIETSNTSFNSNEALNTQSTLPQHNRSVTSSVHSPGAQNTDKRNQVFTPAKLDLNKLHQIKQAVSEYIKSGPNTDDELLTNQYSRIIIDESKYTSKVDPEVAAWLGVNEDGELE